MNYHQADNLKNNVRPHLKCHLCGFKREFKSLCLECSQPLSLLGKGVQKIEDALELHFPNVAYARLDQDTAREKDYIQDILTALHSDKIKILVGHPNDSQGI